MIILFRSWFSILPKYRDTVKYFNRYESGSHGSDASKTDSLNSNSKNINPKTCDVCRSYPCECDPSTPTMYDVRNHPNLCDYQFY